MWILECRAHDIDAALNNDASSEKRWTSAFPAVLVLYHRVIMTVNQVGTNGGISSDQARTANAADVL
jgi:hypothetical protein